MQEREWCIVIFLFDCLMEKLSAATPPVAQFNVSRERGEGAHRYEVVMLQRSLTIPFSWQENVWRTDLLLVEVLFGDKGWRTAFRGNVTVGVDDLEVRMIRD